MSRTNQPQAQGSGDTEAWTTRRLLTWMLDAFTKAGLESPRLQAEMLLAHVINCQRLKLFTEPERRATDAERAALRNLVSRALRHEPIDYLVGERAFFGLTFKVDSRVLVPRPSTETAVEFILQEARRAATPDGDAPAEAPIVETPRPAARPAERVFSVEENASTLSAFKPSQDDLEEDDETELEKPVAARAPTPRPPAPTASRAIPVSRKSRAAGPAWAIADVCTGSGCIAIALAKNLPRATLIATDISTDALDLAIENAQRHKVSPQIEFRHGPLLEPLVGNRFDVIVSNPPYIPDDEWDAVAPNVRDHEPAIALRGGRDGLDLIRPLLAGLTRLLTPGGWGVVETATSKAEHTARLAEQAGLIDVRVLKDVDGLDRIIVGRSRA